MMRKGLLSVAALAISVSGIQMATAADMPMKAPPSPAYFAPPSWTGFYIGVHLGAGWGTTQANATTINGAPFPNFAWQDQSANGFLGGAQAGYNWQAGNWVFGIEGTISGTGIEGTGPCNVFGTPVTCKTSVDWMADISGRLGVVSGNALIYVKGGVAWADIEHTASSNFVGPPLAGSVTNTYWGGLLGVGVEYMVSRNWSAKIEYNYIQFETENLTLAQPPLSIGADFENHLHTIKGGVNYRF